MNIRDILDEVVKQGLNKHEIYSIVCNVDSVDTGDRTCVCTPINGGAKLQDVRIQASLGSTSGLFIEPVVDSKVVVSFLSREIAYISLYTEIENIFLDVDSTITINGGNNDGLVKVGSLVTKLNNLEGKVNAIITAYNAHQHVETGATTATTTTIIAGSLTPTVQADIENTDILH